MLACWIYSCCDRSNSLPDCCGESPDSCCHDRPYFLGWVKNLAKTLQAGLVDKRCGQGMWAWDFFRRAAPVALYAPANGDDYPEWLQHDLIILFLVVCLFVHILMRPYDNNKEHEIDLRSNPNRLKAESTAFSSMLVYLMSSCNIGLVCNVIESLVLVDMIVIAVLSSYAFDEGAANNNNARIIALKVFIWLPLIIYWTFFLMKFILLCSQKRKRLFIRVPGTDTCLQAEPSREPTPQGDDSQLLETNLD